MNLVHTAMGDLLPVNPPVGIYSAMCLPQPTIMILVEKALSMSGDEFSIKDSTTGADLLKCHGKAVSLHDRKKIEDLNGKVLYNIGEKIVAIHKTFVCEDESGKEVLRVKKHWSIGSKLTATFHQNGTEHEIELTGDFWGGSANIQLADSKTLLAHVHRGVANAGEVFVDRQTYFVSVCPGVDIALMAALCICFDEAKNEDD